MCKLEGEDRRTRLPHFGMRIPMESSLGGLDFRIVANQDCALAIGVRGCLKSRTSCKKALSV
ncbi:MAG: hypothetical protein AN490_18370 [Anabaena sp. AL09]|jgi:hypothetical protein|nr:MAG: hypothetical protein AN490_18370 [Anabaena sp. AL09]